MATYVLFTDKAFRIVSVNPGKSDSSAPNGRKTCVFEVIKTIDEYGDFNEHMFTYNRDSHGRYKEGAPYVSWLYDHCFKIDDKEFTRLFRYVFA